MIGFGWLLEWKHSAQHAQTAHSRVKNIPSEILLDGPVSNKFAKSARSHSDIVANCIFISATRAVCQNVGMQQRVHLPEIKVSARSWEFLRTPWVTSQLQTSIPSTI